MKHAILSETPERHLLALSNEMVAIEGWPEADFVEHQLRVPSSLWRRAFEVNGNLGLEMFVNLCSAPSSAICENEFAISFAPNARTM
jgi:hypothetical protein